ncbi:MAG: NUDIX hydrolase [Firmicutes bacterium]|nr:NUDIX hydrolase [Bacillota bacterium]
MPKMKLNSLDTVLEMPYFHVYSAMYENRETSHIAQYDIVSRNKNLTMQNLGRNLPVSAVAILPVDPVNRRILLTREFRMPVNDYLVAIPAGLVDPGEDVRAAVIRELREETGCIADRVMVLPPAFSCIGLTDETAACAIVTVRQQGETAQEENEEITSRWYSYEQALAIMTDPKVRTGARAQLLVLFWLAQEGMKVL